MPQAKITTAFIEKTLPDDQDRIIYWDTELQGFGIRIGKNSKTFICQRRAGDKKIKVSLGSFPAMSVQDARKKAAESLVQLSNGIDINLNKKANSASKGITLGYVFEQYKQSRVLRPATIYQYNLAIKGNEKGEGGFGDWIDLPIQSISKDMVEERHLKIGKEISGGTANKFSRTLRAVLNFAMVKYEVNQTPLIVTNPISRLTQAREWYEEKKRRGHIKTHRLPALTRAINNDVQSPILRDYLLFILLTGCRRREASSLRWDKVDIRNESFIIVDQRSKNHHPLELPLTDALMEIIERRRSESKSEWVFPADSKSGHVENPQWTTNKLSEIIGQHFSIHDLRRTYITIAESLDISQYALKALVNHKLSGSDVTAGYIMMSVERLREPMQRITNLILSR